MGEEEEKTMVVPRAEESTVVLWAVAAGKGMGAVELERGLKPCFPFHQRAIIDSTVSIATGAHAHNFNYVHLRACV